MLQAVYNTKKETLTYLPGSPAVKTLTVNENQGLLDYIAKGDEAAMESFYRRYSDQVFQFAFKTLQNREDAAEVLNEVMLEVWRKPTSFQGRSKISTWLLSITHHKSVDLVRKKSRHDNNDSYDLDILAAEQNNVLTSMTTEQHGSHLRQKINDLPAIYQEVIYLSFYQELSYPDIAEVLSIPVGTVKTRMMHARKYLKQALTQ